MTSRPAYGLVSVWAEMAAMPLVPRTRPHQGRDRRQHDPHAESLQRGEQHPSPVARPHYAADLARPPFPRVAFPTRVHRCRGSPAFGGIRLPSCAAGPSGRLRRDPHDGPRNAGRRLRRALDTTERLPTARSDPPGSAPLTPDRRRRNPLLIAVVPGQSSPAPNHPQLACKLGVDGSSAARSIIPKPVKAAGFCCASHMRIDRMRERSEP